jgi:hypothetical protein
MEVEPVAYGTVAQVIGSGLGGVVSGTALVVAQAAGDEQAVVLDEKVQNK